MTLHPDFPVVSGDYRLSENWIVSLPAEMNKRMEDQDMVLWRPGFTVWLALWGNDQGGSVQERLRWIQSDTSPDAFDTVLHANETPARYSYRLNEDREEGTVYAYYGFALKDVDHLQIAIYVDREADLANAELLFNSVR